jgi:hypothetical protein
LVEANAQSFAGALRADMDLETGALETTAAFIQLRTSALMRSRLTSVVIETSAYRALTGRLSDTTEGCV